MPFDFHLSGCSNSKISASQTLDKMKAHVNASGDSCGSDNSALIDPAQIFFDQKVWEHGTKIGDIFPVSCGRLPAQ